MLAEVLLINRIWPTNPWNRRYRCLDLDYTKVQEVEQPAGACLAIKRRAWEDAGGFDESFFPVWFEDVDFCSRLRDKGWKIVYSPGAVFTHVGGHSVKKLPFRDRQVFWYKNLLRYFRKHHRHWEVSVLRAGIAIGLLLRVLLALGRRATGDGVGGGGKARPEQRQGKRQCRALMLKIAFTRLLRMRQKQPPKHDTLPAAMHHSSAILWACPATCLPE